jgi:V-type H+-transporting ATPase subunit a
VLSLRNGELRKCASIDVLHAHSGDGIVPFGVDQIWKGAQNDVEFMNSLKKKMSIVIGVVHMTFGICLSGLNALHFGRAADFWLEFMPQLLFFLSTFGYLAFLIVLKWIAPGPAPTLVTTMIDMFLSPRKCCEPSDELFTSQGAVQRALLVVALVAVPWMLFMKPCLIGKQRRRVRKGYRLLKKDDDANVLSDDNDDDDRPGGHDETDPPTYADSQVSADRLCTIGGVNACCSM